MSSESRKSLAQAASQLGGRVQSAEPELWACGISYDSRKIEKGDAFFCIPGEHVDGNQFAEGAIASGAAFVVTERAHDNSSLPQVIVPDVRKALGAMASAFYDNPSDKLRLLGVTGTNGKTTTTHLVQKIMTDAGCKTGLIGTLGARMTVEEQYSEAKHTTPQASDLQKLLAEMASAGLSHVSMEVSSHALAQKRVGSCEFAVACLTNITQDHLDFHKTMEHYSRSKRLLFEELNDSPKKNKSAVINIDDAAGANFKQACGSSIRVVTYGFSNSADVHVRSAAFSLKGTDLDLQTPEGQLFLKLKLAGRFNVYNVMAALSIAMCEGVALSQVKDTLEKFPGVAGRFEVVSSGVESEPLCIVDYAHTPDGLDNVLKAAKLVVPPEGKLVVVFGCGGDRDPSKRPQMGEIAETRADEVVVTSDNPRSEDPQQIIANILAGIRRMRNVKVEPDRSAAIKLAVSEASGNDVVVIAGKGHENYQILADKVIPFDDRLQVLEALSKRNS